LTEFTPSYSLTHNGDDAPQKSFTHTNTTERTWRHVMAFLNTYNRMSSTSITWPTKSLRRCADLKTWTSSPSSFLTYDVVRSYEHDRERVVAGEGIPQSLQRDEGLYLPPGPLHVRGGVPIWQRGPVHQVHRHRCIHRSYVATVVSSATPLHHRGHVATYLSVAPLPTSDNRHLQSIGVGCAHHHG